MTTTTPPTPRPQPRRTRPGTYLLATATVAALVIFVSPVFWMAYSSVSPAGSIGSGRLPSLTEITVAGYRKIADFGFDRYFFNSGMIAISSAAISVTLSILAAYALSRARFRARQTIMFGIIGSQLFPFVMLVTPLYAILGRFYLLDTEAAMIFCYVAITLPFSILMLLGHIDSVPPALDEAAEIDGCGTLTILFRIILPTVWPGVIVVFVYAFTQAWEEYLLASAFLITQEKRTLPVALAGLFGEYTTEWDVVMSASVVATIPTMIIFLILQRRLVPNLAEGAVK
ncbi:carbohydrate ABC transporter permease [Microlunatus sp. GCM10028923]|uniref:carbohydrate ABC transporter permease n=1 Tax=Microlunatus sp. GCM10028923 TaxID=3273400 RepID=UPI00362114FE